MRIYEVQYPRVTHALRRYYYIAIVLRGSQAGMKAVIIKQLDEGWKEHPFPHAIVAGIERYPKGLLETSCL